MRLAALIMVLAIAPNAGVGEDHHQDKVRDQHHHALRCTRPGVASVYGEGDGQLGNTMASGRTYTRGLAAVAHKTIRLGRRVTLCYRSRVDHVVRRITVPVLDRGPYVAGRDFDLTIATREALRFPRSVDSLSWRYGP